MKGRKRWSVESKMRVGGDGGLWRTKEEERVRTRPQSRGQGGRTNETKTEFRWSKGKISHRPFGLYELGDRMPSLPRVARFW